MTEDQSLGLHNGRTCIRKSPNENIVISHGIFESLSYIDPVFTAARLLMTDDESLRVEFEDRSTCKQVAGDYFFFSLQALPFYIRFSCHQITYDRM